MDSSLRGDDTQSRFHRPRNFRRRLFFCLSRGRVAGGNVDISLVAAGSYLGAVPCRLFLERIAPATPFARPPATSVRLMLKFLPRGACASTSTSAMPVRRWKPGCARCFAPARSLSRNAVATRAGDCPGLDRERLMRAARTLDSADVAIIPVVDGGYALIAPRDPPPRKSLTTFHGLPRMFFKKLWSPRATFFASEAVQILQNLIVNGSTDMGFHGMTMLQALNLSGLEKTKLTPTIHHGLRHRACRRAPDFFFKWSVKLKHAGLFVFALAGASG